MQSKYGMRRVRKPDSNPRPFALLELEFLCPSSLQSAEGRTFESHSGSFVYFHDFCYFKDNRFRFKHGPGRTSYVLRPSEIASPPPLLPPPTAPPAPPQCPWQAGTSDLLYDITCADGHTCSSVLEGVFCCGGPSSCRGGPIKCPRAEPNMCTFEIAGLSLCSTSACAGFLPSFGTMKERGCPKDDTMGSSRPPPAECPASPPLPPSYPPAAPPGALPPRRSRGVLSTTVSSISELRTMLKSWSIGTILLAVSGSPYLLDDTLYISRSVTISAEEGARGVVLDARGTHESPRHVLHIASGTEVSLNGLALTGAYTTIGTGGGAVHNEGTLRMNYCSVKRNNGYTGAGIFTSGELHLDNSEISFNNANMSGGGICAIGAGARVYIRNVTIEGNIGGFAAGMYLATPGYARMVNSHVRGNLALERAGGLWSSGTLLMEGGTITSNRALDFAGGIQIAGSEALLELSNVVISQNHAATFGGGLVALSGRAQCSANATNVTIHDNYAVQGYARTFAQTQWASLARMVI